MEAVSPAGGRTQAVGVLAACAGLPWLAGGHFSRYRKELAAWRTE